jgi:PBP1b-binding outer membrane lipoprotein LpoB
MRYFIVLAIVLAGCSSVRPMPMYSAAPTYSQPYVPINLRGRIDPALFANNLRNPVRTRCQPSYNGGFTCSSY